MPTQIQESPGVTPRPDRFLIYGAYGYTGELTARTAVERGLAPILAGRDERKLREAAERLNLEYRAFALDDTAALDRSLSEVPVVLHCAGPFMHTHKPMAEACIRTGTHYLDVTGEIPVFASLAEMDERARDHEVMLLPGIGLDVVPTDCLAAELKAMLPTATRLALAICSVGSPGVSRGTAKTVLGGLDRPAVIRKDGALVPVPHLSESRLVNFGQGRVKVYRMVVADLFTAYHSTGIPNIETYVALPGGVAAILKVARHLRPILKAGPVQGLIKSLIGYGPAGPSDDDRHRTQTFIWGEVEDDAFNIETARLRLPESYTFTALSSLAAVKRVLAGQAPAGYQTPSTAFGPEFVLEIEGVTTIG